MALSASQKAEIREILGRYCTAYQTKDLKTLLALFSPDISGYGAGPDEFFRNRKEYAPLVKRDLCQATAIFLEFPDPHISGNGQCAWVKSGCNCSFTAAGKGMQVMRVRITMGLRNTGSRWLIEQIHMSVPNTGQAPGQAFSCE
jgi:ketosteroid isomerase-like protein